MSFMEKKNVEDEMSVMEKKEYEMSFMECWRWNVSYGEKKKMKCHLWKKKDEDEMSCGGIKSGLKEKKCCNFCCCKW